MRDRLLLALELVGLLLIAIAAWLVYMPAGVAVAGVACVLVGWLEERKGGDDGPVQ